MPATNKSASSAAAEDHDADWEVQEMSDSDGDTTGSDDEPEDDEDDGSETDADSVETVGETDAESEDGQEGSAGVYEPVIDPLVFKDFTKKTVLSNGKSDYRLDPVFVGSVQTLNGKPPRLFDYNLEYALVHCGDMRYRGVRDDAGCVYVLDQSSDRKAVEKIVGEQNKFRYAERLADDILKSYSTNIEPPTFQHFDLFKRIPETWTKEQKDALTSDFKCHIFVCSATCKSIIQQAKKRKSRKETKASNPEKSDLDQSVSETVITKEEEENPPAPSSQPEKKPPKKKRRVVDQPPAAEPVVPPEEPPKEPPCPKLTKREREVWLAMARHAKMLVSELGDLTEMMLKESP